MDDIFQFKRNTAAGASANNRVLLAGEPGYTYDDNVLKLGDGTTPWNSLPAISGGGTSGYSGYSGNDGLSGYSGYSGISGATGGDGTSGASGVSGYSGYSGNSTSGYSGYSSVSGYSGYSGPSGYSGYSGKSGYSGYSGISGYSGYSGPSGYSGYSGKSGYSGYSASNYWTRSAGNLAPTTNTDTVTVDKKLIFTGAVGTGGAPNENIIQIGGGSGGTPSVYSSLTLDINGNAIFEWLNQSGGTGGFYISTNMESYAVQGTWSDGSDQFVISIHNTPFIIVDGGNISGTPGVLMPNLPGSPAGLASGALWNNSGTLCIA